jgi:hypothetical protein
MTIYHAEEYLYFQQGWMEAVKEIWDEIKDDVER